MKRSLFSLTLLLTALLAPSLGLEGIRPDSPQVERLVRLSGKRTVTLYDSQNEVLNVRDVPAALKWVRAHPDISSLHVLMRLRQLHPQAYASIPAHTKARILLAYLKKTECTDDWSYMSEEGIVILPPRKSRAGRPQSPWGNGRDFEAGQALLELSAGVAVPQLIEVLQDEGVIGWSGSAAATRSYLDQLRRCDFAYRYICILTGRKPQYYRSMKYRDHAIAGLMKDLGVKPIRPFEGREYRERSIGDE